MTETKSSPVKPKTKKMFSWLQKLFSLSRSTFWIGLFITFILMYICNTYYQMRNQNEYRRSLNPNYKKNIFSAIDNIDHSLTDYKFKFRGEVPASSNIALVAIDDESVTKVGRWPWSREKIALLINEISNYGASAIGLDVIFSEKQENQAIDVIQNLSKIDSLVSENSVKNLLSHFEKQDPDRILAQAIKANTEKVVLGLFDNGSVSLENTFPYMDYCRNVAFIHLGSEDIVKLNPTFIVEDEQDPFVDLNFDKYFNSIFKHLSSDEIVNHCDLWLTQKDNFSFKPNDYSKILDNELKTVFSKSKILSKYPLDQAVQVFKNQVHFIPIHQKISWTGNIKSFHDESTYSGSFNVAQDSDGKIRRTPLLYRTGNRLGLSYIPALALQTYLTAHKYRADVKINIDKKNKDQKIISSFKIMDPNKDPESLVQEIPISTDGFLQINYSGSKFSYPHISAHELLDTKSDLLNVIYNEKDLKTGAITTTKKTFKKASFIKNKSFIVGATATALYDLRVTPFQKDFPGPEIHMNILDNLEKSNYLKSFMNEEKVMLFSLFALGLLLTTALTNLNAIPCFIISILSMIGVLLVDFQILFKKGFLINSSFLYILITSIYIILFFYKYLTEERKKKYLRSTFSKYVSPQIVDEVLKHPENVELGGKKQEMSVMFSDLRGFTTISEKLDPTVLSDVLNEYLTPMTKVVFKNKGTLDKYMGDAIMSFYGAPFYFEDHAVWACRCALESLETLKVIQADFKKRNLPNIEIGIGINSSAMSVGNMGSDIVRSYTVMGDAVNLASRLEGTNKEYGTRVIISEFTYEKVKDLFVTRELDWVKVKGKNLPVKIYELIAEKKNTNLDLSYLNDYNEGYQFYRDRKFDEALLKFKSCVDKKNNDEPSKLFIERTENFLLNPPPIDWDGVYVFTKK